uniref:Retrotransposon gag domain-containing protein n=1 Tax=Chromera velia CCMP2878 TaxID=1169474 RepID=A0A0G4G2U7_9ALVE|eukprot:Cvel_19909.t1-p1 / transcript=Cvel_19909.t1 / gene=Cvel_19909 / organism=Chromera_velia_CCMP2878 / gene_product=hypothetical protein / transcript_product=hypothetical protein / location=Cvel_scaffold1750:20533-24858(+) / protein_length=349 / sequence_SO=supercontig / SO=protein_coding / is_pseudo=false
MAKGRLPAYLKEWYEKFEEEHGALDGVFSNWESLKTKLMERLKVTMERSITRAKLQTLCCTEALGVEKYNEAFSQLVGQLPHLWEEDVVEDYIKGLPNSIALDVAKAKIHTLLETQKEAAEIEAFFSFRAKGGGHRDFRLRVPESGGVSGQHNQPLVPEEGPVPMDLCGMPRATGLGKLWQLLCRLVEMGARRRILKGSGHAVVIPSRVPPSRRSGGGDTETQALRAEGVVVMESVEVAVMVDDLESGRSTKAMKREKCPQHVIKTTNSGTWGAESFEEGDQNANGSGVCALCAGTPSKPEGGGLPHSAVGDKILSRAGQGKLTVAFCSGLRRKAQGRDRPGEGIVGAG